MAKYRFYLSAARWTPGSLALEGEEAHHCLDVMRCRVGDRVDVFDGKGRECEARLVDARRGSVTLEAGAERHQPRPMPLITLAQAIPKGKNMDLIVQKATELGVGRIVPLLSGRTVVQCEGGEGEKKRQKWERVALEACKQCGQNWLPQVLAPVRFDDFIRTERAGLRLVAAIGEGSRSLKAILRELRDSREGEPVTEATVLIGPEGDFNEGELGDAEEAGFLALSLGSLILRSETAAMHALSLLAYELGAD